MTGVLFIDLRKAFDCVPQDALLCKFKRYGIGDNALDWFTNSIFHLSGRTQAVSIGNELSKEMVGKTGVPHGQVSGVLYSSVFI